MPDEIHNQSQTIDDLILDILADEAQIIRCLRVFFCETLQEIADAKCISAERKVKLATELISAAAQKETALAAVLEAISLFEVTDDFTPLLPGESYPLAPIVASISKISLEAKTKFGDSQLSVSLYGGSPDSMTVSTTISQLEWNLGASHPVEYVNLYNSGSNTVYIRNLALTP